MNTHENKVALITGANRGIGFETAKGLGELGITVIIGARDLAKGATAADKLRAQGMQAEAIVYDAADPDSADAVYAHIAAKYGIAGDVPDQSVRRGGTDAKAAAADRESPRRSHRQSVQHTCLADTAQHGRFPDRPGKILRLQCFQDRAQRLYRAPGACLGRYADQGQFRPPGLGQD